MQIQNTKRAALAARVLVWWLAIITLSLALRLPAQDAPAGPVVDPATLSWPRYYATNGFEFAVYQPQINAWPGNQLQGRFVVAVRAAGTTQETYGVVFFQAQTAIDKVNRLVTLDNFSITRVSFPGQPAQADQYRGMLASFQGQAVKIIPLDHLEAVFAASADIAHAKVQTVNNDPPQLIFATVPSLLILVDGPPVLQPLSGNYQRVINTRAVLLFCVNPANPGFYLYADSQWYSAPAVTGPWIVATNLGVNVDNALSAALATQQVDPMYPTDENAPTANQVFVATAPAELIETAGAPNLVPIPGTDLSYVQNSSRAIFNYSDTGNYYVLVSGRWFTAGSLSGPWSFVPPGSLPGDFAKIPPDHEKSNVLMSVPGTPQAREAVIANAISQTATVLRSQAALTVNYYGAPSFTPIAGTALAYAANTQTPVVQVSPNSYYACQGGVWFTSAAATGPWVVADNVPDAIYTIPASCPIHYATYAYVYGSTPTAVEVGYTPGYMGPVVAPGGVVVYGTGYNYPPVVTGGAYVAYPPSYGYGASFALGSAVGYSYGYAGGSVTTCCCQPYWGAYAWAAGTVYNYAHCNVNGCNAYTHWGTAVSRTGSYGYNAYTGTPYASRSAVAFNPYTGMHASANGTAAYDPYTGNASDYRSGSSYNTRTGGSASGSASASAYSYTGNYDASKQGSYNNANTGESVSGQKSVSGNYYNGTATSTGSGSASNSKTGNSAAWSNGSMTSDMDGNTYNYNKGDTTQNQATAQSENAARQASAQATGQQRYDSYAKGGGGGWGGYYHGGRR